MKRCLVIFTTIHVATSAAASKSIISKISEPCFRKIIPKDLSTGPCKSKQNHFLIVKRKLHHQPKSFSSFRESTSADINVFRQHYQYRLLSTRGGAINNNVENNNDIDDIVMEPHEVDPTIETKLTKYTILSQPAPGSPFHYAFPVHDLQIAKEFYGKVLGCTEGRSSTKWQDYSLHGHQIVAHWVGNDYRCQDYYNPVDGDEVPVPRK
jgi:hypothetical protein